MYMYIHILYAHTHTHTHIKCVHIYMSSLRPGGRAVAALESVQARYTYPYIHVFQAPIGRTATSLRLPQSGRRKDVTLL